MNNVLLEVDILSISCPTCNVGPMHGCLDKNRHVVLNKVGQSCLSFHDERIQAALTIRFKNMVDAMDATEKALILLYAFIRLCDAVSVKSEEVLGKRFSTQEMQIFFAQKAVEELRKDGLIANVKTD